jgi:hypothetical protein
MGNHLAREKARSPRPGARAAAEAEAATEHDGQAAIAQSEEANAAAAENGRDLAGEAEARAEARRALVNAPKRRNRGDFRTPNEQAGLRPQAAAIRDAAVLHGNVRAPVEQTRGLRESIKLNLPGPRANAQGARAAVAKALGQVAPIARAAQATGGPGDAAAAQAASAPGSAAQADAQVPQGEQPQATQSGQAQQGAQGQRADAQGPAAQAGAPAAGPIQPSVAPAPAIPGAGPSPQVANAGPGAAGPAGAVAEGAHAEGAQTDIAGAASSAGPQGAGPQSAGPQSAGPQSAGPVGPAATPGSGAALQPSQRLLQLAGQNPQSFLEGAFAQSPDSQQLKQFSQENAQFVQACQGLQSLSVDEVQHQGVDPFKVEPYKATGFNWESLQAVLSTVGDFAGKVADITGIVGTVCKVAGWVLTVLAPPVGAALNVVGNFLTLVEIIANIVAAACAGINAGIDVYRLCTTDNPQERLKFAARFADNVLTTVGRGGAALMAGGTGGIKEGRAAMSTLGKSLGQAGRGALKGLRSAGKGLASGGRMAGQGIARGGATMGKGAAQAGRGVAKGAGQAGRGAAAGAGQAGRGVAKGARQASSGVRQGARQASRGLSKGAARVRRGLAQGGRQGERGIEFGRRTMREGLEKGGRSAGRGLSVGGNSARAGIAQGGRTASRGLAQGRRTAAAGMAQGGRTMGRGAKQMGRGLGRGAVRAGRGVQRGARQTWSGLRDGWRTMAKAGGAETRALSRMTVGQRLKHLGYRKAYTEGARGAAGQHSTRVGRGLTRAAGVTKARRVLGTLSVVQRGKWTGLQVYGAIDDLYNQLPPLLKGDIAGAQRAYLESFDPNSNKDQMLIGSAASGGGGVAGVGDVGKAFSQMLLRDDTRKHVTQQMNARYNQATSANRQGAAGEMRSAERGLQTQAGSAPPVHNAPAPMGSAPSAPPVVRSAPSATPRMSTGRASGGGSGGGGSDAARQIEVYEQQLAQLEQQQAEYEAARVELEALEQSPLPDAAQGGAPSAIATLDADIAALGTAEQAATQARDVFQQNVEAHKGRAENAATLVEAARERRAVLDEQETGATKDAGDISKGQAGVREGEQKNAQVSSEGQRGQSEGKRTQGTVNSTRPEAQQQPPEEDVPWYRIDKHAVNLAKQAWQATVGRAMAAISEKWAQLKAKLTEMLVEFALGLAGGDDLKKQMSQAGQKGQKNATDNTQAQQDMGKAGGELAQGQAQAQTAEQLAQQTANEYADLVVEAETAMESAQSRKAEAQRWRDEMQASTAGFADAYGPTFEAAAQAQSRPWGQTDQSQNIAAVEAQLAQAEAQLEAEQAAAEQGGGEPEPQGEAPAQTQDALAAPGTSYEPAAESPGGVDTATVSEATASVNESATHSNDGDANAYFAQASAAVDHTQRGIAQSREALQRTLVDWDRQLAAQGVEERLADITPEIVAQFDQRTQGAHRLLNALAVQIERASAGDEQALSGLDTLAETLTEILEGVEATTQALLEGVSEGYLAHLEGAQE